MYLRTVLIARTVCTGDPDSSARTLRHALLVPDRAKQGRTNNISPPSAVQKLHLQVAG